jgi:hypothetical protein
MTGNINQLIASYPGDPTNVDASIFDAPQGALILDTTGGSPRFKTTGRGDNSGMISIGAGIASSQNTIPVGAIDTIPAGSQAIIFGTWTILGTVIIGGEVRIGAWPF